MSIISKPQSVSKDALEYMVTGRFGKVENASFAERISMVLKCYVLIFGFNMFAGMLIAIVNSHLPAWFHTPVIEPNPLRKMFILMHSSTLGLFIITCIGAPLIEETSLRLPLSFKPAHIALGISVFAVFLSVIKLYNGNYFNIAFGSRILFGVVLYFIISFLLKRRQYWPGQLSTKTRRIWIACSIVTFGLLHIFNFWPLQGRIWFIYPLFVLPQIGMGWFLTYIRLRNGIAWSMLLHLMINLLPFLFFLQHPSHHP